MMFLANSDQETIQTIQSDPYCPYKIFIKFHQRLIQFSISNALFKQLNLRQCSLTHIVLNMIFFFRSALHFLIFLANFDQRTILFDQCYLSFKNSIKKKKKLFQIFIKQESRTGRFVP